VEEKSQKRGRREMNPNYCHNCGKEVNFPADTFCPFCGTALYPRQDKAVTYTTPQIDSTVGSADLFSDEEWDDMTNASQGYHQFISGYKNFLSSCKTEREVVRYCTDVLGQNGFLLLEKALEDNSKLSAGMRVYQNIKQKAFVCAIIGEKPLTCGARMLAAHADSPHLNLKINPVYEDSGLVYFDTTVIGTIKNYHWIITPLALHGTVIGKDGKSINVCIGENDGEPVFTITDLLPHLSGKHDDKKLSEAITGEDLDVIAAFEPYNIPKIQGKTDPEAAKEKVFSLLRDKYGISERDFVSAELSFVPAQKPQDVGLHSSMIGAYGHDDKSCVHAAFSACLHLAQENYVPQKTVICIVTNHEECGTGNSCAEARIAEKFIKKMYSLMANNYRETDIIDVFDNSEMILADVNAAYDPRYADVYDKKTAPFLGGGIAVRKDNRYGNYANAEFTHKIIGVFDSSNIMWQNGISEKVDKGGLATESAFYSTLGLEVLDAGIPVLSMHSPFEVISKKDLWAAYQAYRAFLKEGGSC
jgi:aspartyl aminopeptidase